MISLYEIGKNPKQNCEFGEVYNPMGTLEASATNQNSITVRRFLLVANSRIRTFRLGTNMDTGETVE
ncbi:unnamed protein product [Trifolium pratense]|uniref:Uncharacterized protein n=2 Tax=Trifolium pratense TaxID=57577 RepID=A0ACB0I6Q9_TRIPR|nr:unnamed protein product [Trifolium pratense]CAJ2671775.1 unnamed protein product [Trifolium pratense]